MHVHVHVLHVVALCTSKPVVSFEALKSAYRGKGSVATSIHDKQAKAKINTQDRFLSFQRKNCPGWDSNPRHSTF